MTKTLSEAKIGNEHYWLTERDDGEGTITLYSETRGFRCLKFQNIKMAQEIWEDIEKGCKGFWKEK